MKGLWVTVAIVVVSLLAGCADPEATPATNSTTEGGAPTVPDAPSSEPNSISGTVVDTEFRPVPDATVTLTPGDQATSTDAAGAFAFYELEPGTYSLLAQKDGYTNGSIKVDLVDEPVSKIVLSLEALPSDDASHETRIFKGYLMCFIGTQPPASGSIPCSPGALSVLGAQNVGEEKVRFGFEITAPGFRHLILEAKWVKQGATNCDIQYFIEAPSPGVNQPNPDFMGGTSGTPVWDQIVAGTKFAPTSPVFYPTPDKQEKFELFYFGHYGNCTTAGALPAGALIEWRPEFHLSFFYNGLAPAGFSALPKD